MVDYFFGLALRNLLNPTDSFEEFAAVLESAAEKMGELILDQKSRARWYRHRARLLFLANLTYAGCTS